MDMSAEILLPENTKVGMPGDNLLCKFRFEQDSIINEGQRFALRESGKTIGHGIITKILDDDAVPE